MGLVRIIADFDIRRAFAIIRETAIQWRIDARDWRRGWTDADIINLAMKLDDSRFYSGGIIKLTIGEHRAWWEFNRRLLAQNPKLLRSPLIAWAEGKGLFPMIRLLPPIVQATNPPA
jgi:hypothetical protein